MSQPPDQKDLLDILSEAKRVFDVEIEGLRYVSDTLDQSFLSLTQACLSVLNAGGKIVICGLGKSGHIGHKIAATLASTGSTAVFMHPVEAFHGDIGILQDKDILVTISYSGETDELIKVLPAAKRLGVQIAAITGNMNSRLAEFSDITVSVAVPREACPFNLAPTTTTTVTLALGDALAMTLLKLRGFTKEDFGRLHPGGAIGRSLTLRVREIMRPAGIYPAVSKTATVKETLLAITKARCGSAAVVDEYQHVIGIFTDGDFRRRIELDLEVLNLPVSEVMTANPLTIHADALVAAALKIFETRKINNLVAVESDGTIAGGVDIQDLPGLKLF